LIGKGIVDARTGCQRLLEPAAAGVPDAAAVLVFVATGWTAHADGVTLAGIASTSWPILARGRDRPVNGTDLAAAGLLAAEVLQVYDL
jgi:hypothetical protein